MHHWYIGGASLPKSEETGSIPVWCTMKVGRDYSWWVDYTWEYEYFDEDSGVWESFCDYDAQRFNCTKKDLKKTVTNHIIEKEVYDVKYRNLVVTINDSYMTTTEEI